jgi:hypothetical protein
MTKFKFTLLFLFTMGLAVVMPATTHADFSAKDSIQCGVNTAAGKKTDSGSCHPGADSGKSLEQTVTSLINILSIAVGVVAVIMLVVGGFRFVVSAGNDSAVSAAKNTIVYAIVGLVIVALAQIIVHFVLGNVATSSKPKATSLNLTMPLANENGGV